MGRLNIKKKIEKNSCGCFVRCIPVQYAVRLRTEPSV